jgi:hypothetical protein
MHRGNVLRKLSRPVDALASYDRALALKPDYAEALIHRADALADLGRHADAILAYRLALDHGGDSGRIQYSLAALGGAAVPKASPVEYVTGLFDQYAEAFDDHLVETPEVPDTDLARAQRSRRACPATRSTCSISAAAPACAGPCCGRWHVRWWGSTCRPRCSPRRGAAPSTTTSVCAELAAYLDGQTRSFDVAIAADVFVYIGDLNQVFAGCRPGASRPGGVFAFLGRGGRSARWRRVPAADDAPLRPLAQLRAPAVRGAWLSASKPIDSGVIRKNGDTDILGHLVVLRQGRASG